MNAYVAYKVTTQVSPGAPAYDYLNRLGVYTKRSSFRLFLGISLVSLPTSSSLLKMEQACIPLIISSAPFCFSSRELTLHCETL